MYTEELKKLIKDIEKILEGDDRWDGYKDNFLKTKMKRIYKNKNFFIDQFLDDIDSPINYKKSKKKIR